MYLLLLHLFMSKLFHKVIFEKAITIKLFYQDLKKNWTELATMKLWYILDIKPK